MELLFIGAFFLSAIVIHEAIFVLAAVITLVGTRLCWSSPRRRMSIEERAKDGELTEDQARWKIQVIGCSGPAVTLLGVALLAYAILK